MLKTTLHHYYLALDKPAGAQAYKELCKQLKVSHAGKFFNAWADTKKTRNRQNKTEAVELDPSFLFENQWNEAGNIGRRLFDWYEGILYNKKIKEGHWLEITPEMVAIRQQTLTCGYCGKYVPASEPHKWYCEKCLGGEYLKEKDLGLLRLLPVATSFRNKSFDMTEEERAEILPLWKEAQGLGAVVREKARLSKNRQKIARLIPEAGEKSQSLLADAETETAALTWLLDHELNIIDNVIFYNHTQRFCFGWRNPLSESERSKLLDVLCEFPFDYDLK